jgi:hypothetical protein
MNLEFMFFFCLIQINFKIKIIFIEDTKLEPTITQRFFAGSIAGGLAQSIIYPLEVKQKYYFSF